MVYRFCFLVLLLVSTVLSGCQVYNSSTNDQYQYSSDGTPFGDAKVVLAMKCTPCHSYYLKSQSELQADGLFSPGDIYTSEIFSRLKGANVGGQEDMPANGQLSDEEIDLIRTWIEGTATN
jgi:uncharacterized membrane protein